MKTKAWMGMVVAGVLASGAAQAALVDRGGGLIYDTTLNITWLQDANYAKTSGYDADGLMTWSAAKAWADQLTYGGYSDWRLASNSPVNGVSWVYGYLNNGTTDEGMNISSVHSELGYMFYVDLGLHGYYSANGAYQPGFGIPGISGYGGQADVGLVKNLQSYVYWSGTAYAPNPGGGAWQFNTAFGGQGNSGQGTDFYAWAVRDGDVGAAVPEPATLALTIAGLGLAGLARRRRDLRAA